MNDLRIRKAGIKFWEPTIFTKGKNTDFGISLFFSYTDMSKKKTIKFKSDKDFFNAMTMLDYSL